MQVVPSTPRSKDGVRTSSCGNVVVDVVDGVIESIQGDEWSGRGVVGVFEKETVSWII